MKRFLLSTTVFLSVVTNAQVGINTTDPHKSSILDIESTDKGVLFPRMTEEQRDAITNPAEGLIIYNTTKNTLQINTGKASDPKPKWRSFSISTELTADLKCETIALQGTLKKGKALSTENLSMTVNVTELATEPSENDYSIETDSPNGYKFSASGTFTQTGEQTINLQGSGTPTNAQTDNLTLTFKNKTCNIKDITVSNSQPVTKTIGRVGFSNSPSRRMSGSPAYFDSPNWGNAGKSWSAMLYDKDLIETSGTLNAISFLIQGQTDKCTAITPNQKIYMKLVDESSFSNKNNEKPSQMTEVFSGNVTWIKGSTEKSVEEGWTRIVLDTPFEYNNTKNLLIYFVNESNSEYSCLGNYGGPDFAVDANGKGSNLILSKYAKYKTNPRNEATDKTHRLPVIKLEFN